MYEEDEERLSGPYQWYENPAHEWLPEEYRYLEVEVVLKRHPDWRPGLAPKFASSRDVLDFSYRVMANIPDSDRERVFAIFLTVQNEPVGIFQMSVGGPSEATVHPVVLFRAMMLTGATGVVLVHNHPSGYAKPSQDDIKLAKRMTDACKLLGVRLLDVLVIGAGGEAYSFTEQGR